MRAQRHAQTTIVRANEKRRHEQIEAQHRNTKWTRRKRVDLPYKTCCANLRAKRRARRQRKNTNRNAKKWRAAAREGKHGCEGSLGGRTDDFIGGGSGECSIYTMRRSHARNCIVRRRRNVAVAHKYILLLHTSTWTPASTSRRASSTTPRHGLCGTGRPSTAMKGRFILMN